MTSLFIGPMSVNIVDAVIQYCNDKDVSIGLIPSRRQIEWNGGYVNQWLTKEFVRYVRSRSDKVIIQRDHGGPGQGSSNVYTSFSTDAQLGMDLIHIDPWKNFSDLEEAVRMTKYFMEYCHTINPSCRFEVGTEEAIRRYEAADLDWILSQLDLNLVEYAVVQFGTSIVGTANVGVFDVDRAKQMIEVCRKHGVKSKEHNGDYLTPREIHERLDFGLDAINIAPEFGVKETLMILSKLNQESIDKWYQLCYDSRKWEKWIGPEVDPERDKLDIITVSGHYIFAHPEFKKIKATLLGIDEEIKQSVWKHIDEILSLRST